MFSRKQSSTITAKGQTTIPKAVRQALGVTYGGRISFGSKAPKSPSTPKMLAAGTPPTDFPALIAASKTFTLPTNED